MINSILRHIRAVLPVIFAIVLLSNSYAARFDKDSLLKVATYEPHSWDRISALLILSDHYSSFYKDSALMYARQSLEMSRLNNNIRGQANSLYAYAMVYINSGDLAEARACYVEGIKLCEANNEIDGRIEGLMHLSFFYESLGKNDSMTYCSLLALDLTKKTGNIEIQAGTYNEIGNLYLSEGNYDKALYYCEQSLETWNKIGHKNIAGVLSDIGNIYYNKKDYINALGYYRKAFENAKENNDAGANGFSLNNIGLVCYQLDSVNAAIGYYNKSIGYYIRDLNKEGIANVEDNLAECYLKTKQYPLALENVKKSLEFYNIQNYQKGMQGAYLMMASAESALGKYKDAWMDQKRASEYQDSLNMLNINKKTTDYETKMQVEKTDNENNLLRAQAAIQKSELKSKTLFTIFIGAIMVLCLIIALIALKSTRKRKKQLQVMTVLNEEITGQKQVLEETDELKTKLFSIVSHDFKSPLASLQLFLSMFEEGDFTKEEVKELSGKLMERMNVTFSFIENLLGWAQSQLKGYEPNLARLNLHNIAEENFDLYRKQAEWKEISFRNHIDPDEEIVTDENMLKLVLRNLMSNAIKYTPKGGRIEVGATNDTRYITISVCDTGVGLAEEMTRKIFTSQRVNTYGTFNEPGTGLGLMLCREFLERNGGSISVESEPGNGSVFSFKIPVKNQPVAVAA